jgi:transposase
MEHRDARSLSPDAQRALRERVIRAVEHQGLSKAAAARAFGLNRSTVSGWWAAYRRDGPAALAGAPRGRKPKPLLAPDQEARLLAVLTAQAPDEVGLAETLWTREAVGDWAARALKVQRSRWVWGRWRRAKGFTPQKPARRASQRDPAAVERWLQEEYPRVEREAKAEGAEIHWLDEAGLRSDCQSGRSYAPRGKTPVVAVPGKRFGVNYIATVTNLGVLRFQVFSGRFTAAVLLVFLARLLAGRPGKVYVVLDGHPSHRAKKVAAWVAARSERIRLVFLPPYSPELNPAELLNNDVKANAQRAGRARDRKALSLKVRGDLRATQRMVGLVQRYFRGKHVRYAAA